MRHHLSAVVVLAGLIVTAVSPSSVLASGILLPPTDPCLNKAPQNVNFSKVPRTYIFTGTCNLMQTRLAVNVDVPWTGVGTYDPATGKAAEDIIVPPPTISQPSRPYGRFLATMHCAADPWLDANVKCDQVVASSNPPANAYPPNAYGRYAAGVVTQVIAAISSARRPYTAQMNDSNRQQIMAQYQSFRIQEGMRNAERSKQLRPAFKP
ncbi:hypothetical protein YTPLAS18_07540 [Nitrospira sp.]|nr:hypothetical protein YTPLAS18_07540 [Nitrospira sp.]